MLNAPFCCPSIANKNMLLLELGGVCWFCGLLMLPSINPPFDFPLLPPIPIQPIIPTGVNGISKILCPHVSKIFSSVFNIIACLSYLVNINIFSLNLHFVWSSVNTKFCFHFVVEDLQ